MGRRVGGVGGRAGQGCGLRGAHQRGASVVRLAEGDAGVCLAARLHRGGVVACVCIVEGGGWRGARVVGAAARRRGPRIPEAFRRVDGQGSENPACRHRVADAAPEPWRQHHGDPRVGLGSGPCAGVGGAGHGVKLVWRGGRVHGPAVQGWGPDQGGQRRGRRGGGDGIAGDAGEDGGRLPCDDPEQDGGVEHGDERFGSSVYPWRIRLRAGLRPFFRPASACQRVAAGDLRRASADPRGAGSLQPVRGLGVEHQRRVVVEGNRLAVVWACGGAAPTGGEEAV